MSNGQLSEVLILRAAKTNPNPNPGRGDIFVAYAQQNNVKLRQKRHHVERRLVCLNDPVGNPGSGVSAERRQPASVFRPKMRRSAETPLRRDPAG